jgi:protein-tyrosine phosphatase
MVKVLFICLGNICRSPLAEGIFNQKVKQLGLEDKFSSDSCGTSDYHIGELPDERTLACAQKNNILISHRARQLNRVDLRDFDYLVAMDMSNKRNIQNLMTRHNIKHKQLFLLREFHPNPDQIEVPDPYYGGEEGFEQVYKIIEESLDHFLERLKLEHNLYV